MKEIEMIIEGYNQEKLTIQKIIAEVGNYNSYNQARINDLKARQKELDSKIDILVKQLLSPTPNTKEI